MLSENSARRIREERVTACNRPQLPDEESDILCCFHVRKISALVICLRTRKFLEECM